MDILSYVKDNELHVHVIPGAARNDIRKVDQGIVYIALAAPPEKGKANRELCNYLKKLTKRQVRIKTGEHARNKVVVFM
ncbi:DUF167 domain-containing protein [Candidatus Woesearchaeota archaeon]|nr:DUF167 domain-containing protein [Candidatus Woesearchaeota archaeon]